jgi:RNA polymerase sigma-70 factor (ECF subfamily)
VPIPSDQRRLIEACLRGDQEAWRRLWEGQHPHVARVLASCHRHKRPHDIEDMCQELFTLLWEDRIRILGGFQGRCSLTSYLGVVAFRRSCRMPAPKASSPFPPDLQDSAPSVLEDLEQADRIQALRKALSELPPRELLLVQLVHLKGLSPARAAGLLRLRPGHARVILHRARERLGALLSEKGGFPS